jgi:glycine oxidase
MVSGSKSTDVAVLGAGLIGLSVARGLAAEGLSVRLFGHSSPGEASPASAGMLAPSVERSAGAAHDFAVASRDLFPGYLASLEEESGIRVPLNRLGILQVAMSAAGVKGLRKSVLPGAHWIEADELHKLEPALGHGLGAVFTPDDGSVDNKLLLEALHKSVRQSAIHVLTEPAVSISSGTSGLAVTTESGELYPCATVVVAAGAWSSTIEGARYAKHVTPAKGQMLSYDATPLRHVVYGPRGYLVPRARGHILAGSTMEDAGFDSSTTPEGIAKVKSIAAEICPSLGTVEPSGSWAGLRPVTPDLLPLLGADPDNPGIVYACGHSRNGVLLAPLTGEIVTDLVVGRGVGFDLTQFRPDRFQY